MRSGLAPRRAGKPPCIPTHRENCNQRHRAPENKSDLVQEIAGEPGNTRRFETKRRGNHCKENARPHELSRTLAHILARCQPFHHVARPDERQNNGGAAYACDAKIRNVAMLNQNAAQRKAEHKSAQRPANGMSHQLSRHGLTSHHNPALHLSSAPERFVLTTRVSNRERGTSTLKMPWKPQRSRRSSENALPKQSLGLRLHDILDHHSRALPELCANCLRTRAFQCRPCGSEPQ